MLSAVTTSLLVCVVKLFIWYVAVCCLCVRVPDILFCGMFGIAVLPGVTLLPAVVFPLLLATDDRTGWYR